MLSPCELRNALAGFEVLDLRPIAVTAGHDDQFRTCVPADTRHRSSFFSNKQMRSFPVRALVLVLALTSGPVATHTMAAAPPMLAGFMVEVVNPAANTLWSSRGKTMLSDKDWDDIKQAAAALSKASTTLSAGGSTANDRTLAASAAWRKWSAKFTATAQAAVRASDRRDRQALVTAGNTLIDVCHGCHTAVAVLGR
jgi:cytochrome c556